MTTIELSPLLVAADGIYPGEISVINGGIPAIMSGMVDVATNAETQLLRQSVDDPDLRVIFTVAEGLYRIVARKSAGIHRIADLKGKRITTPRNTSAHYFLVKMLATAHLSEADVTLVAINPVTEMSAALKDGRVDAVAMWEPESDRAVAAVGPDAIVFEGRGVYRELFNLNTSVEGVSRSVEEARGRGVAAVSRYGVGTDSGAASSILAADRREAELHHRYCLGELASSPVCGRSGAGSSGRDGGRGSVGGQRTKPDTAHSFATGFVDRPVSSRRSAAQTLAGGNTLPSGNHRASDELLASQPLVLEVVHEIEVALGEFEDGDVRGRVRAERAEAFEFGEDSRGAGCGAGDDLRERHAHHQELREDGRQVEDLFRVAGEIEIARDGVGREALREGGLGQRPRSSVRCARCRSRRERRAGGRRGLPAGRGPGGRGCPASARTGESRCRRGAAARGFAAVAMRCRRCGSSPGCSAARPPAERGGGFRDRDPRQRCETDGL